MLLNLNGRDPRTVATETWPVLGRLRWYDTDQRPGVLAYTPVSRGNPFQATLYSRLMERNIAPVPGYDITTATELLAALPSDMHRVLHLHWLNVVLNKARSVEDGRGKVDAFVDRVAWAKDHGVRVWWTLHNVLPHDTALTELEVELRERVISLADVVHVMSRRSADMVAPWFALPADRTYHCDHPGYQGVYPAWIPREQARLELGIPADALTFVMMGAIKPYKGLTELLDALDVVAREHPGRVALVVAGQPDNAEETKEFVARAGLHPSVHLYARKVVPDDVQLLFNAADVALVPYRRSLNSGALVLALSFGIPVVMPEQSGAVPLVTDECAVLYDQDAPDGLVQAMREAHRLATPEARTAARAAGARFERDATATKFATDLRAWLDGTPLPLFPTETSLDLSGLVAPEVTPA